VSVAVTLVAAVADNGVIGRAGGLPWRLPEDWRLVKERTTGGVLVMGRRTYESIGRALPGRTSVVVTRDARWAAPGVLVVGSVPQALELARQHGEVFVFGGAQIYAATLSVADRLVLTRVHESPQGDTFWPGAERGEPLPDADPARWREVARTPYDGFDLVELVPVR
jgi:dihydrofolate reductase